MKVCYEVRGDNKYAYRSTSRRELGKKYPVTIKEYLGVIDPATGNIIPKKVASEAFNFTLKDGSFRTKDYGNVILIKHIAEELGILHDLEYSFGTAAKGTLALAMAQAMAPTAFMDHDIDMSFVGLSSSVEPARHRNDSERGLMSSSVSTDDFTFLSVELFISSWKRTYAFRY